MSDVIVTTRPTRIPDPYERTRNDPHYLMSSNDVLKLVKCFYKEDSVLFNGVGVGNDSGKEVITDHVVEPIIKRAESMGWGKVKLVGKQLEFIAFF